jgi:superfamily II DNA or RNA helicase
MWDQPDPLLVRWIEDHRKRALESYRANPLLVEEHGRQEDSFRTGGYANRQVLELVQNAADALRRAGTRGRVELVLKDDIFYCANEGEPFSREGLEAICHAYLSDKRGDEIGRFGLGFKSVLGVTDEPMILSRSISFGFRAQHSRDELAKIANEARNFPVLRLPFLVGASEQIAGDPVLADLATWAKTIVRLPITRELARLMIDMRDFPEEFLLFAPFVNTLQLVAPDGSRQRLRCESIGDSRWRLHGTDGTASDWMVWSQTHRPSADALEEVGEAVGRAEVAVSYAAPLDDSQALGRFWAHFPLQDITSARGIHNAPWRINDDRTNMLEGRFNEELLQVTAELIVQALPHLSTQEDPAKHFDYLPARGREAHNFADRRLTELIPAMAASTACVPDADGLLRRVSALRYPHLELHLETETLRLWASAPGRPVGTPHWTCFRSPTRRARLRSLIRTEDARASQAEIPAAQWLESIVGGATDEQCDVALQVFFSVKDENTREHLVQAAVVPDTDGRLGRLSQTSEVYLRGNRLSASAGLRLVRPSFLDRAHVEPRLRSLGFEDVDPKHELRRLATTAAKRWGGQDWSSFWDLVLEVTTEDAKKILLDHVVSGSMLKVRCRDSSWQHIGAAVVAGVVEPADGSLAVDEQYHELHLGLLSSLGVGVRPVVTRAVQQDLTQLEYLRLVRATWLMEMPPRGRPNPVAINWVEDEGPASLHVLRRFKDTRDTLSQTAWTRELLEMKVAEEWSLWLVNKSKRSEKRVQAPHLWAAATYGLIDTSWGPRQARVALSANLTEFDPLLPVAKWSCSAKVETIDELESVTVDVWREYLMRTPTGGSPHALGAMAATAVRRLPVGEIPDRVPCVRRSKWDSVPPADLTVASTDDEVRALKEQDIAFVAVDVEVAPLLIEAWGCQPASSTLRVEIVPETPDEPIVLLDRFRRLRDYSDGHLEGVQLIGSSGLMRVITMSTGTERLPEEFAVSGHTLYFETSLPDDELLARISAHYGLGLDAQAVAKILNDAEDERIAAAMAVCRAESDVNAKLLALLPVSVLETALPAGLLQTVRTLSGDDGAAQVGDLLNLVHGSSVLIELKHQLKGAGYPVPEYWAGSGPAIAFVRSLGFSAEYAGERGGQLASEMTVLGPPNLKELHGYQKELAGRIRELARERQNPRRALLFLPTGAGKTRVTVQALVESIIIGEVDGPVLWIAQTEELCEQAVQTWNTVWREFGDRPLRICRLWSTNEVADSGAEASVVVATDAKLDRIRDGGEYEWLREAAIVVIDEAHGATAVGITATLKWLGLDGRTTSRPLLGLTATPFKGTVEETNKRLVTRFGSNLLDVLGDDPYGELQRLGVLAKVRHKVLPGSSFSFDSSERAKFETFRDVPSSVLERVGRDHARTARLLDDIADQPSDWPILVFTASVLAAQTLSALLRVRGVESATVSGSTPAKERRRTIEAFRSGDVQVLTNCNVLTQGFDAPGVRALYIARPTFSPNAYIQMVGRGLRGEANGGKKECLIVNVADTFEAFGEALAYRKFDYLWHAQSGDGS